MASLARALRAIVVVVAAVAVATTPASAQIQPGTKYRGGDVLSDPESGLRLTMPAGWSGQLSPDGEVFLMAPDSGDGRIIVLADELSEDDARRQLGDVIDLGGGLRLTPVSPIKSVATSHLSADYSVAGAGSPHVATVDVRLMSSGVGVAFILLAPPATADSQRRAMREFAFSLGVTDTSSALATSAQGASNDAWEPYLRGKYLARFFTRTGYTESTELWLCSDGTFAYVSQGGGFGGGASGAARGSGGGRWSATGAGKNGSLTLHWSSGGRTTMKLLYDYEQNRMYINDERVLRGKNERCR